MKKVFSRTNFQEAKGGNLYEFKETETSFEVAKNSFYVIKVIASAKNAKQNNLTDDDDLRMTIDDYAFGKYEQNKEQLSWKGFNTSASWNGTILKGESKTIYFFVNLDKGTYILKFYADNTPKLTSIEVFEIENNHFNLNKNTNHQSFIFTNTAPKSLILNCSEAFNTENLILLVNGKKLTNENLQKNNSIHLTNEDIIGDLPFENSIEIIQYDISITTNIKIEFHNLILLLQEIKYVKQWLFSSTHSAISYFKMNHHTYSAKLLGHSLYKNPPPIIYKANHPIVRLIKSDSTFQEIITQIYSNIKQGHIDGEITPNNIIFKTNDLKYAIHGIKKIEYTSTKNRQGKYDIKMILFDVYDFKYIKLPPIIDYNEFLLASGNNIININEELGFVNNFEVQIHINVTI